MNLVDAVRMLLYLVSVIMLIRTVEPDPTGGKGILPMRQVMVSWLLLVLQAMQIALVLLKPRQYGWTPTGATDLVDVLNLVFAIIVFVLIAYTAIRVRGKTNDANKGSGGNDHDRYE